MGSASRPAFFRQPIADWDDLLVFRYLCDRARAWWGLARALADREPVRARALAGSVKMQFRGFALRGCQVACELRFVPKRELLGDSFHRRQSIFLNRLV